MDDSTTAQSEADRDWEFGTQIRTIVMLCTSAWPEKIFAVRRSIGPQAGDIKGRIHPEAVSSRVSIPTPRRTGATPILRSLADVVHNY